MRASLKVEKPIGKSAEPAMHIVVIGGGPVGIKFANEIRRRHTSAIVTVFSDEKRAPYNRAQLSLLLAGQVSQEAINLPIVEGNGIEVIGQQVVSLDCEAQTLVDSAGDMHTYDYLVFATGARAHIPQLKGIDLNGVYPFRSLDNTESLLARKARSRHVVVVGGGLLGIETAVAMNQFHTRVTLVHQADRLMNRQLDETSAELLKAKIEAQNIEVILNHGLRAIKGENEVEYVQLRGGLELTCDTVILCCGSAPNIELARQAKIRVNRGIVVSPTLATSQENVFAIGECCEYEEQVYGLVSPGYDQALVLADYLSGGDATYQGSDPQSLLKVLNFPLRTFGQPINYRRTRFDKETVFQSDQQYVKLITTKSQLVGGIAVGEASEFDALFDAYLRKEKLPWYRRLLLKFTGRIWPLSDQSDTSQWSDERFVCKCHQVSLGKVCGAINNGAVTVKALGSVTGAGTTCGGCQPLLANIVASKTGEKTSLAAEPLWGLSVVLSIFVLVMVGVVLSIPGLATGESVTKPALFEWLWNDKFWKQVTGFTLLGLSAVGLLVSLRKRFKRVALGRFVYWRFAHVTLGALCIAVLLAHTGLHLGTNLNQWLSLNFITILSLGALTSSAVALSHRLTSHRQQLFRKSWNWLHILAAWPLPVLLAAHILTVYKY